MASPRHVAVLVVTIDGTKLDDSTIGLLHTGYVEDSTNIADAFMLRFRDPDRSVVARTKAKVGSEIVVAVQASGAAPETLVTAVVTAVEVEYDGTGTYTVIRGMDPSYKLFHGRKTKAWLQVKASDVASQIAGSYGLKTKVDATSVVFDHLTQANMSDGAFLKRLALRSGRQFSVIDGTLHFDSAEPSSAAPAAEPAPSVDPLKLALGTDILRLRAGVTSSHQVSSAGVRSWNPDDKAMVMEKLAPSAPGVSNGSSPATIATLFSGSAEILTDTPYPQAAAVTEVAKGLAQDIGSSFVQLEAIVLGNPKLGAGTAISIGGLGDPFDGKYVVTSSRHVFDPDNGYQTWITVSGREDRTLLGLANGGASAGPHSDRIAGVVPAIVTDIADPTKKGRVKVKYPWLDDSYVSDWCRTAQVGAGAGRGSMLLPEVNDEVLVAFEQGDPNRPFVLAGLYNGKDAPASHAQEAVVGGKVERRSFHTRVGHRLAFVDAAGKESIELASGDGKLSFTLGQAKADVLLNADGTVTVKSTKGVLIDSASSNIELKGNQIKLTAQAGVTVNGGSGAVQVSTSGNVTVKGTALSLSGDSTAELKGGGMTTISGGVVKIN